MKKILVIGFIVFFIFQMITMATVVDMGAPAIDRLSGTDIGTYVSMENPASDVSYMTSVEIWAKTTLSGVIVATFENTSGNNLTSRDSHYIGTVTAGAKRTYSGLKLLAFQGDYIGLYYGGGQIEVDTTGGIGIWTGTGNLINGSHTYGVYWNQTMSLYGTGTEIIVPGQVTNVQATDGVHTDKVVITWNAVDGAEKYYIWQGLSWVDVGDVLTYDYTGAPAPTITAGTASASDETSDEYVTLSIAGESANIGSSISYKVKAWNPAGYGPESASNSGYRGVGALTYQWQRSAADSDENYSNIDGATTDPYNDTGAPEDGSGRYFKCVENATGAAEVTTNADRGYRISGWSHLWNTKEIAKFNTKEFMKWNALE